MSAGCITVAVFEFAAAEPCVRAIPGNVSASAPGWDGDFSRGAEAFGDCEHDSRERVSVLVSVPRVLHRLKQKIERDLEDGAAGEKKIENFRRRFRSSEGKHSCGGGGFSRRSPAVRGGSFGRLSPAARRWIARPKNSGTAWVRGDSGVWLTETTSLISVNHPFKLGKGSIGKVLPGREVKLAEDGEIMIRGGGVAAGYWGAGHAKEVVDEQGWYRTGDVARWMRREIFISRGERKK